MAAIVLAAFVVLADRITKQVALTKLNASQTRDVIPNTLGITLHLNYGAMANVPIPILVIACITVIILVILVHALWKAVRQDRIIRVTAFACIIGGAVSNLFDRLSYGYVIDWILLVNRSVVNLADIAIFIGVLLYLISIRTKIPAPPLSSNPKP
jgi:signal peptidase II